MALDRHRGGGDRGHSSVIDATAVAGALLAWVAMSVLVLSEGRFGLAVGLVGAAVGLAATLAGSPLPALVLGAAGAAAGALRARDGQPGWGVLPPGSTPRVILCVVAGAGCAWVGGGLLTGPQAPARAAVIALAVMAAARLLTTHRRGAALASGAALALATGALGALASGESAPVLAAAGGAVALVLALLPAAEAQPSGA
jgi:hypothetical protein